MDKFLVETGEGTRVVPYGVLKGDNKDYFDLVSWKRQTYRGKNLGNVFTEEQAQAIKSGTFDDIFLGDYWEMQGHKWRVADFDYYYRDLRDYTSSGFLTSEERHHVTIWPDDTIGAAFNIPNVTNGYMGMPHFSGTTNTSEYVTSANSLIENIFGTDHILGFSNLYTNKYIFGSGAIIGGTWAIKKFAVPNEFMLVGHSNVQTCGTYAMPGYMQVTTETKQLSLFKYDTHFIQDQTDKHRFYWLRDACGESSVSAVISYGYISDVNKNNEGWYRPIFNID